MKNKNGFTLLELLVVVVIISILIAIASITGKAWLDRYRVESQMKQMSADLMNARISAMQQNRMYFVTLTATQYKVYQDANPADPANPPVLDGDGVLQTDTDRVVTQTDIFPLYSLTIPASSAQIIFDTKGQASASPGPMGAQTMIRVTGTFNAAYDCIVVSPTKTRLGAMNGATCDVQ